MTPAVVAIRRSALRFVYPEVDDDIDIEITRRICALTFIARPARAVSTLTVPNLRWLLPHPDRDRDQCQNDRSQHKNKDQAMKQMKAKLYELEMQKKNAEKQAMEDNKSDIGWGSQIRSYVLDDSRIKDLRTGVETRNTRPCWTAAWINLSKQV
ncbi:peptide chain release factor 2 [Escherichia coli]|uniref:Peptide chain release factor 2 n=1 Tax=Escherichia coli TaxID=562 RepID=A0A2X1Q9N0_ECOLX|nr:peptide chain release factor 2 [Escherichia coli]